MGRGVERPWWTINWVAWQRDHPKWTFGQRHRRALVHLEELESAESAERTLSGYDENVEALPYRCMWLWGETDYVSSYDMWWCPQLHVDRPGFSNPCRCQLCQTLGGINLTVDIEDSMKKHFTFGWHRLQVTEPAQSKLRQGDWDGVLFSLLSNSAVSYMVIPFDIFQSEQAAQAFNRLLSRMVRFHVSEPYSNT